MNGKTFEDFKRDMSPKSEDSVAGEGSELGPCAWQFNRPVYAIDFEDGAKPVVSFQYVGLDSRSELRPESFTVTFVGLETWRVTVTGRNLRPIFDRINEHRIRRIRKTDRDFGDEKKPVVTGIDIRVVPNKGETR